MNTTEVNKENTIAHPQVASREAWNAARHKLLEKEKYLTRERDRINAERRRLPMVKLSKNYVLEGADGLIRLQDIFDGKPQLIIYHFMFDPKWEEGCPGCTGFVDELGDISSLGKRNTSFALISRAPINKLLAYKEAKGWLVPWYSSFDSDFNFDFNITHDPTISPLSFQYPSQDEVNSRIRNVEDKNYEDHGLSVFFNLGDEVYHCYSTHARGVETLTDTYSLLDMTPYGRQEDWEDSPEGFPQRPTYD